MALKKSNLSISNPLNIRNNLLALMQERSISEAKLARETRLPQTTINRLLTNQNNDPRISTLLPIAQYFSISLDNLIGIPSLESNSEEVITVPIISWKQLNHWQDYQCHSKLSGHSDWITINSDQKYTHYFGVRTLKIHEPYFCYGSVLVVARSKTYEEGMTVIVKQQDLYICRKLAYYDKHWYVTRLGIKMQSSEMISINAILGHVAEVRINLN